MKNIVIIMVDAFSNVYLKHPIMHGSIAPFVDEIKAWGGVYCDNVYSQGPYTEAALTPLYTGRDNLDRGGNFFRGDECDTTLFEYFRDHGYETYNYTQNAIYPEPVARGLNTERYGLCFMFSVMWVYRLQYYAELPRQELTPADMARIVEVLRSNLYFARQWLSDIESRAPRAEYINRYRSDYDFSKNKDALEEQISLFEADKNAYARDVLQRGTGHPLFAIEDVVLGKKLRDKATFNEVYNKHKPLFKRLMALNKRNNRRNNRYGLAKALPDALRSVLRRDGSLTGVLRRYSYYRKVTDNSYYFKELFEQKDDFKAESSIGIFFDHFIEHLDSREQKERPYIALIHTSSLHTPAVFFSPDRNNIAEVDRELEYAKEYLDGADKADKGNLIYALSARYNDMYIKRFMEDMAKRGYDKNTVYLITADHGSSFMYYPLRTRVVNNMHVENYNVPCVVCGDGVTGKKAEGMFTTKDIAATVCTLAGLPVCPDFTGKDIFGSEQPEYAISEYTGGGCPDLARRDIKFCIRSKTRALMYTVPASGEFSEGMVDGIYDTEADPYETTSLPALADTDEVKAMLSALAERFAVIKAECAEQTQKIQQSVEEIQ